MKGTRWRGQYSLWRFSRFEFYCTAKKLPYTVHLFTVFFRSCTLVLKIEWDRETLIWTLPRTRCRKLPTSLFRVYSRLQNRPESLVQSHLKSKIMAGLVKSVFRNKRYVKRCLPISSAFPSSVEVDIWKEFRFVRPSSSRNSLWKSITIPFENERKNLHAIFHGMYFHGWQMTVEALSTKTLLDSFVMCFGSDTKVFHHFKHIFTFWVRSGSQIDLV